MKGKERFKSLLDHYQEEHLKYKKHHNLIGLMRLGAVVIGILFTYLFVKEQYPVFYLIGAILSYVLFGYLIYIHNDTSVKLKKADDMVHVNKRYISRFDGSWVDFEDCGDENIDEAHAYTSDLDIFGKKSLFQLINTTKTYFGRNKLRDLLKGKDLYTKSEEEIVNEILKRQGGVRELSEKVEFCESLECGEMGSGKFTNDPEKLLNYAENSELLFESKWVKGLFYILPVVSIVSSLIIVSSAPQLIYIPVILFFLHGILGTIGFFKTSSVLNDIYKFKKGIESYNTIISIIEKEEFSDNYLKELKNQLFLKDKTAAEALKELNKIVDKIDYRYNILSFVIFNIILLGDYHCIFMLEAWREKYGQYINPWFNIVGEFESMASLSVVIHLNEKLAFPIFSDSKLILKAKELGHPLIDSKERVCNDANISDSIFIVTGSNMSGKTTFLRTVGINLVLAYAGAPVCAEYFKCSIMDIFTSMRINDDLNNGISTFYAELKRIKLIINHLETKRPMIFLIDEIFRGTNSQDRIIGAKSVLKNLNKNWVMGLISTHDFELCDLESINNRRVRNYHFSEYYVNNEIKFDYKLQPGRSKTTNAKYLMRMIGIELTE